MTIVKRYSIGGQLDPIASEGANATGFLARLKANLENVSWLIVGDSTGNATNEWVYLTTQALAAQFPTHTVVYHLWDATSGTAYEAGVTVQTGTGANTLHVWNCSVSGQNVHYTRGYRWPAAVVATNPHYITVSHGHNEGTTAQSVTPDIWRSRMLVLTESLTEQFPMAALAIVLQNPRGDAVPDQQRRAAAYREIAQLRGYGIIDAQSAFLAQPSLAGLVDVDNVHPTPAGSQLWAAETIRALTYSPAARLRIQGPSALVIPGRNLLINGDFASFASPPTLPSWTAVNCAPAKDVRAGWVESATGWSVRLQATTAAATSIYQDVPTGVVSSLRGRYVTFTVRMRVPSGQAATAGRVQISDSAGNYAATTQTDLRDGFHWMTATRKVDAAASYIRATIHADTAASAGADISIASAHFVVGLLPRTGV